MTAYARAEDSRKKRLFSCGCVPGSILSFRVFRVFCVFSGYALTEPRNTPKNTDIHGKTFGTWVIKLWGGVAVQKRPPSKTASFVFEKLTSALGLGDFLRLCIRDRDGCPGDKLG